MRYFLSFAFLLIFYACADNDSISDKIENSTYEQVFSELNATNIKIEKMDTIYYIESSACLSCKEKFWSFYNSSKRSLKVICQIDNNRVTISQVIPNNIKGNPNILLHHSNKLSTLFDSFDRDRTGVFRVIIDKNHVKSVKLFMD